MSASDNKEAQLEEITVLSSIYGDEWLLVNEECCTYALRVTDGCEPVRLYLDFQVTYVESYPSDGPPLYDIGADWLTEEVEATITSELQALYDESPGDVVLFRWVEWLREFLVGQSSTLESLCTGPSSEATDKAEASGVGISGNASETGQAAVAVGSPSDTSAPAAASSSSGQQASAMGGGARRAAHVMKNAAKLPLEKCPRIIHGETLTDRKSVFQPHCATVETAEQVKLVQAQLLTNRKIAQATHNIMAYRIFDEAKNAWLQDCDDDGETAAGSRVLHLMQILEVRNVVVVVTRWYGGVHLGADRFKHINSCARAVLVQFGAVQEKGPTKPGKGKKPSHSK